MPLERQYVDNGSPPSSYAISDVYEGVPGAWGRVLVTTAQRSLFIFPGLLLAGIRDKRLVYGAVGGSISITCALLIFYGLRKKGIMRAQAPNGQMV